MSASRNNSLHHITMAFLKFFGFSSLLICCLIAAIAVSVDASATNWQRESSAADNDMAISTTGNDGGLVEQSMGSSSLNVGRKLRHGIVHCSCAPSHGFVRCCKQGYKCTTEYKKGKPVGTSCKCTVRLGPDVVGCVL